MTIAAYRACLSSECSENFPRLGIPRTTFIYMKSGSLRQLISGTLASWSGLCFLVVVSGIGRRRSTMRVQDVMTNRVHTVSPGIAAEDAWNRMRMRRIHHLVVTQAYAIVGLLSERDLGGAKGTRTRENQTVADLMSAKVLTVSPTTPIRKAANMMRSQSVGCLVVADGARIAGIITVADLLELMGRGIDRPVVATTRPTLNHRAPHRKQHRATGVW